MGARPSNLSEAKSFLDSIKLLRANYDVPAPQICRLHKSGADLVIYSQGDSDNALVAKIISLMPCEGLNHFSIFLFNLSSKAIYAVC